MDVLGLPNKAEHVTEAVRPGAYIHSVAALGQKATFIVNTHGISPFTGKKKNHLLSGNRPKS